MNGRVAVVSHLLAALVTTLDPQHLRRLATRVMSDSCMWVSRLFRYDANVFAFIFEYIYFFFLAELSIVIIRTFLRDNYLKNPQITF